MAVLNLKHGYLFLAEPETGSRSCAAAMQQHGGYQNIGSHHHSQWQLLQKKVITKIVLNGIITFSVIRNPFDILVTRTLKGSNHPLRYHIAQYRWNKLFYRHHGVDRQLKYERGLEQVINRFFVSIGAPPIKLDMIGKSPGKGHWREYYSEADLEFAKLLIPEIEAYGYG